MRHTAAIPQIPRQFPVSTLHARHLEARNRHAAHPGPIRRSGAPASKLLTAHLSATPCRSGRGSADRVLPSLSHGVWAGVSEPSVALPGVRQWSCFASFPHRSQCRAPSPSCHYSASSVLRAHPPPCRPGLPLTGVRLVRATPPTGIAVGNRGAPVRHESRLLQSL